MLICKLYVKCVMIFTRCVRATVLVLERVDGEREAGFNLGNIYLGVKHNLIYFYENPTNVQTHPFSQIRNIVVF